MSVLHSLLLSIFSSKKIPLFDETNICPIILSYVLSPTALEYAQLLCFTRRPKEKDLISLTYDHLPVEELHEAGYTLHSSITSTRYPELKAILDYRIWSDKAYKFYNNPYYPFYIQSFVCRPSSSTYAYVSFIDYVDIDHDILKRRFSSKEARRIQRENRKQQKFEWQSRDAFHRKLR